MADAEQPVDGDRDEVPKKRGVKGLVVGLALAIALGAVGFYAVYSGLLLGTAQPHPEVGEEPDIAAAALPPVAFVPLDPLVVSLGAATQSRHLRFRAELEVEPGTEQDVARIKPRVMDVLNSYLRAVAVSDLEDPAALVNLRAQMLRRIQLVAGEGRVRDLLIMEFVVN